MKQAQHERHTMQVLGQPFPEVHKYLDEFHDTMGPEHRARRHHSGGVEVVISTWGMLAGAAACLHIWADEVGLIEKDDGTFGPATVIKPSDLVDGFIKASRKCGYMLGEEEA